MEESLRESREWRMEVNKAARIYSGLLEEIFFPKQNDGELDKDAVKGLQLMLQNREVSLSLENGISFVPSEGRAVTTEKGGFISQPALEFAELLMPSIVTDPSFVKDTRSIFKIKQVSRDHTADSYSIYNNDNVLLFTAKGRVNAIHPKLRIFDLENEKSLITMVKEHFHLHPTFKICPRNSDKNIFPIVQKELLSGDNHSTYKIYTSNKKDSKPTYLIEGNSRTFSYHSKYFQII